MYFSYCFRILGSLYVLINFVNGQKSEICGVSVKPEGKTCVSVKLPWEEKEVFLCTDKKVPFVECDKTNSFPCWKPTHNNYASIFGPWMCCPYITEPDPCASAQCPAPPHNRKCVTPKEVTPHSCCPEYYCGPGNNWDECKERMQECPKPPPKEKNCLMFGDIYSCCAYYQCKEDEKPGKCPKFSLGEPGSPGSNSTQRACVGDKTCPDDEKCCKDEYYYASVCRKPI